MQSPESTLKSRHVILGVSGSIAAYKACALASLLVKEGAEVHPVLTRGGARFVTPASFAALCGRPVLIDEFDVDDPNEMTHIALAQRADAVVLAPASANLIARLAAGMADDMLTLLLLVTRAPVLLAPAMNTSMWTHPIVAANVLKLQEIGYRLIEPGDGRMACGTTGPGKLAEPEEIAEALRQLLSNSPSTVLSDSLYPSTAARPAGDLSNVKILITAGPTREPLDGVRYLSNRSSGKMGYAIARAALERGATVTLLSGPTSLEPPPGARFVPVVTAAEMLQAVMAHVEETDVVIGAAAVADFTVEPLMDSKIKRGTEPLTLALKPTIDILAEIGKTKGERIHVGFAAEMGDPVASARAKLAKKNLDLVVANDVTAPGAGFDTETNLVVLVSHDRAPETLPLLPKIEVAHRILDWVAARMTRGDCQPSSGMV